MLSQLLTLYTTPVIYLFFDAAARRISALRGKADSLTNKGVVGDGGSF
jgi:hypothetical protein